MTTKPASTPSSRGTAAPTQQGFKWRKPFGEAEEILIRRMHPFEDLKGILPATKNRIRPAVQSHEQILAKAEVRRNISMVLRVIGLAVVAIYLNWMAKLAFAVGVPSWGIIYFVAVLGWPLALYSANRAMYYRCADSEIADRLLGILAALENGPTPWDAESRRDLLRRLEALATFINDDLLRAMKAGDADTDKWWQSVTKTLAQKARSLKQWVVTPKLDTTRHLERKIASCLGHVVTGDWDAFRKDLEPIEADIVPSTPKRYRGFVYFLTTVLVSSLPISLVWFAKWKIEFGGTWANVATGLAILWAAVSVLVTIDPRFTSKLAIVKDVTESLRGK